MIVIEKHDDYREKRKNRENQFNTSIIESNFEVVNDAKIQKTHDERVEQIFCFKCESKKH